MHKILYGLSLILALAAAGCEDRNDIAANNGNQVAGPTPDAGSYGTPGDADGTPATPPGEAPSAESTTPMPDTTAPQGY